VLLVVVLTVFKDPKEVLVQVVLMVFKVFKVMLEMEIKVHKVQLEVLVFKDLLVHQEEEVHLFK
jgi:hypothetical protein